MLFLAACPCIAACGHRMVSLRVIQGRKVEWNRHDWISGHGETRSLALPVVYVTNSCIRYPALVVQSCPALCDPMDCSTPGLPVLHYLPEFAQTHVHWVGDTIQPSHPLSPPFPPALHLSQHQGLFQWVDSVLVNFKHLNEKLKHGKRKKPSSS